MQGNHYMFGNGILAMEQTFSDEFKTSKANVFPMTDWTQPEARSLKAQTHDSEESFLTP